MFLHHRPTDPGATALAILGLMALATAVVWVGLFMFVKPAHGDTVDGRMLYVLDGDTLALAGEGIRLLGIDAPETRKHLKRLPAATGVCL